MVPPGEAPNVRRAVRLLAVDALANSFAPEAPADRPESEGAGGIRARNGPGLAVWGYVEAVGLDQSKMSGRLSLRRKEDSSVAKGGEGGAPKPVERVEELEVAPDQAQAFFHFVPYSGLGLEPGRHDLILSYSARCEGLSATLEEEYRI